MPRKNEGLTAEGQKRPQKADISKNGSIDLEELRKRDKWGNFQHATHESC